MREAGSELIIEPTVFVKKRKCQKRTWWDVTGRSDGDKFPLAMSSAAVRPTLPGQSLSLGDHPSL